eukprot:2174287-Amphidinium_carterae.1
MGSKAIVVGVRCLSANHLSPPNPSPPPEKILEYSGYDVLTSLAWLLRDSQSPDAFSLVWLLSHRV